MTEPFDLVCLSHLRWDFVTQRPQHLLRRCAQERRVFFWEEPVSGASAPRLDTSLREDGRVHLGSAHVPDGTPAEEAEALQRRLLGEWLRSQGVERYVCWYYTPMAMGFTQDLTPLATIYDCMDELSAFRGAPPALLEREAELLRTADLVFTGGQSLYESKRDRAAHVYAFPSSVDVPHFAQARQGLPSPDDQKDIAHPRLGFFGVIDERLDLDLIAGVADLRPDWQWVIIGPVVKIDESALPHRPNIHYLGGKDYKDLPAYLSGWDVATLLFARNESTRFISPTKTPEYLAAGRPVVSTSIRDVVRPYGEQGLVRIADAPDEFVAACEAALTEGFAARQPQIDAFLSQMSWDRTWTKMRELIESAVAAKGQAAP